MNDSKKLILAGCVIRNSEGKILLLHRNTDKRVQWELPGGKVEENESPAQASVREIKEELGVDVEIVNKLGSKDFSEDSVIMEYVWYSAKVTSGVPEPRESKFDEVRFFSISELEETDSLSPNVRNLLGALQSKEIIL